MAYTRDPLETKRTRRARIADVLTGRTTRTAAIVSTVAAQVAAGSLTALDGATFGLFDSAVADISCSITATDKTLTSPNNPWTSADVGKVIDVQGAGASGATLRTFIASYTAPGEVELATAASTTVAASVSSAAGLAVWGNVLDFRRNLPAMQNEAGTVESSYRPGDALPVDPESFGAVGDGVTDDTAALNAAFAAGTVISLRSGPYRITSGITVGGGKYIKADKTVILKEFDGIGLTFNGGSDYSIVEGDLEVRGYGTFAGTGLVVSTSANAHGILISGSRVRVIGALRGNNHKGSGISFVANGNANKCDFNALWAGGNNVDGVAFTGTQDDCSVWDIKIYAQTNYKCGVSFSTDFMGRNWRGYIYAEGNAADGSSSSVDIGKLRSSALWIYSEQGTSTGMEIDIRADCTDLDVFDARANLTRVHATAAPTCRTYTGGRQRSWGLTTSHGTLKLSDVNNNSAKYSDFSFVTSEGEIAFDRVRGDRMLMRTVYVPGGVRTGIVKGHGATQEQNAAYGYEYGELTTRWNGTLDAPTSVAVNDVAYRQYFIAGLAALASKISATFRAVVGTFTATKASMNLIWATTRDGASAVTDTFQVGYDGNIEVLENGKGIRLRQPDGTVRLLTVSNAGALVIT